ncbi:hypothetical protein D9Q98_001103 [Chlorella vulgaris]|uniref:Fe2OG dioxygenase domain-containing protein n=1 Tax=Chlorella vulgaris TaxID=3077 RepID=A0A9D4Z1U4_CHLVU|nr:hypothetical protein D9Q98_001103 [Chlorella vulgaris]
MCESKGACSAFRAAEKRYQVRQDVVTRQANGRRRRMGFAERPVDLTDVLDPQSGAQHPGVTELSGVPFPPSLAARCCAFSFASHPGLLLIRSALDPSFQRQLVMDALQLFCEPPNHTNHVAAYPNGLSGVWAAAQQGLRLQLDPPGAPEQEPQQGRKAQAAASDGMWGREGSGPEAESLLRRLRWATLGPQYDWTRRRYLQGEDGVAHMPLPPLLRQLAVSLADLAADLLTQHSDCRGRPEQAASTAFRPNAALINYYRPGDTLNGHRDDAECCLDKPLVSLSLGCDAIFLLGGTTRDVAPTALLLHSGDALVLCGPARRCYHGVPRVLTDRPLPPAMRCCDSRGVGGDDGADGSSGEAGRRVGANHPFLPFERHMRCCRINISIRDTL